MTVGAKRANRKTLPPILKLCPEYRDYVWGGQRLQPGRRVAESWVVHENNRLATEPFTGQTLAEVARRFGPELLGERVFSCSGARFPLLLKLLDSRQWLSLQVHPNDEQAARLEGPESLGKTEAWHVLEADPGAQIIAGMKPGITRDQIRSSVGKKEILNLAQYLPMERGQTVLIRAGTLHALGPGLLVYEIQQSSDITYRVYDWDRPASENRKLHVSQAQTVLDSALAVRPIPYPTRSIPARSILCQTEYFLLETVVLESSSLSLDAHSESFSILTLIEGQAEIQAGESGITLGLYESVLLPADAGGCSLRAKGGAKFLLASVPQAAPR